MDTGKKTLLQTIAEQLRRDISQTESQILPAVRVLAQRYGVSVLTLRKATKMLAQENLLSIHKGRRIRIIRNNETQTLPEHPLSVTDSTTKTIEFIQKRIADGTFKAGRPLPKIGFFVRTLHVSDHTVSTALKKLAVHGMVEKRGKSWVTGQARKLSQTVSLKSPPVILLIQPHPGDWNGLVTSQRTTKFCSSFNEEMDSFGVRLLHFPLHEKPYKSLQIADYRNRIGALTQELGSRCLGALLIGESKVIGDIRQWSDVFKQTRIRAVWFDRNNEKPYQCFRSKTVTRCYFSEENAVLVCGTVSA